MMKFACALLLGLHSLSISASTPAPAGSSTTASRTQPGHDMKLQSHYPVIVTAAFTQSRDYWRDVLGYAVAFESSWFVYLQSPDGVHGIAFMRPDHPSRPPGPETYGGQGVFLTLQVADAGAVYERLRARGVEMAYDLHDEDWGQRRFAVKDPSGTWIDVVEQTAPKPGYWERYPPNP
ncbi:VOC family protein [Tahibacter amnicola]|uniref:VOC family protein n=1 Tax=Tahibacter amnicola TaxID=2976241 RepID=A0ABY6BJX4_9GAMM|nr:VOC family protein [Tahibacter amnicola]UXI70074.1 VOC family protein [Tahibacter amnicola]